MKIFLETASTTDIEWATGAGLIDGVSTSPSLFGDDGAGDPKARLAEICRLVDGPVFAEVVSVDADNIYREARELARLHDALVVKIPMIEEGIHATRRLVLDGVRVCTTFIFTPTQALLAAKAGATFVSPYVGWLDDIGHRGTDVVRQVRSVFDNYGVECDIVAAALRTTAHVNEVALLGTDAAMMPAAVLRSLLLHPLTDRGIDQFLSDVSRQIAKSRVGTPS